jgi:hypothetical protein
MQASGRELASADGTIAVADAVMDATSAVRAILRVQECSTITKHHLLVCQHKERRLRRRHIPCALGRHGCPTTVRQDRARVHPRILGNPLRRRSAARLAPGRWAPPRRLAHGCTTRPPHHQRDGPFVGPHAPRSPPILARALHRDRRAALEPGQRQRDLRQSTNVVSLPTPSANHRSARRQLPGAPIDEEAGVSCATGSLLRWTSRRSARSGSPHARSRQPLQ